MELYKKCVFEFNKLKEETNNPEYDYALFNIILTLNHLFEWYILDNSICENRKIECIKIFNPYEKLEYVPRHLEKIYKKIRTYPNENKNQTNIRKLSNDAKHFKQLKLEKQSKNYTSVFGSFQFGPQNQFGSFDHYIYFVKINEININLEDIIESLLNLWSNFITQDSDALN